MRLIQNHFKKVFNRIQSVYKKYGWKAVLGIVAYYLVRDITLYVLIPYFFLAEN